MWVRIGMHWGCPARARRRHRRPRREPRVAHHRSRGARRGAVLGGDRRARRASCPASSFEPLGPGVRARDRRAGPARARAYASRLSSLRGSVREDAAAARAARRARSASATARPRARPRRRSARRRAGRRGRRRSRGSAGRAGTAGGSCRRRAPPAATPRARGSSGSRRTRTGRRVRIGSSSHALSSHSTGAPRAESTSAAAWYSRELPAVERGVAGPRQPAVGKLGAARSPRPLYCTTTTSGSNDAIVCGHVAPSPRTRRDGCSIAAERRLDREACARACTSGSRRSRRSARPVAYAQSSRPRPSVWPTESPTTRMRSGRCRARAAGAARSSCGGRRRVPASRTSARVLRARSSAARSACALSGANTMVGAGSDAVTRNSAVDERGDGRRDRDERRDQRRARCDGARAPRRIGCSTKRNEATASVSVSADAQREQRRRGEAGSLGREPQEDRPVEQVHAVRDAGRARRAAATTARGRAARRRARPRSPIAAQHRVQREAAAVQPRGALRRPSPTTRP